MSPKMISACLVALFVFGVLPVHAAGLDGPQTERQEKLKALSPEYRAFLSEAQLLMLPEERRAFLDLKTDAQRDRFIEAFWKSRQGWENINTLFLLRMTQVLDLSEEQAARIFSRVNRTQKAKRELNRKLGTRLRNLRAMLRDATPNEEDLRAALDEIKELRDQIRQQDEELEAFLAENLSVLQFARYLIFTQDFLKGLREKLRKARESIRK